MNIAYQQEQFQPLVAVLCTVGALGFIAFVVGLFWLMIRYSAAKDGRE